MARPAVHGARVPLALTAGQDRTGQEAGIGQRTEQDIAVKKVSIHHFRESLFFSRHVMWSLGL